MVAMCWPKLAKTWLALLGLVLACAAPAQALHEFNLPAQPLSDSLRSLGDQARINVIFDPAEIGDTTARALSGDYDVAQALNRLLEGTGFVAEFTDAATVVVRQSPPLVAAQSRTRATADARGERAVQRIQPLAPVTVLGSLIPRSQIETTSPVITISSIDLSREGYRNVYDALHALPLSTGPVQDNQAVSQGTFTAGANVISLFGLDPSFTMILLDGHPLAEYPLPYNGTESVTDLSNIPIAAVDHIDIITGGQSSLYGSSAIAGVVNIVLKKDIDKTELDFRIGGYDNGGGENERFQLIDGFHKGRLSMLYALDVSNQSPIRVSQSFWPSHLSSPLGPPYLAGMDFTFIQPFSPQDGSVDPGQATCARVSGLFGGTTGYQYDPQVGHYCGSFDDAGSATLLNKSLEANGYLSLSYRLEGGAEFYADLLYGFSSQVANLGPGQWIFQNPGIVNSGDVYPAIFWDAGSGNFASMGRYFAPEEMGGTDGGAYRIRSNQYNNDIGFRGGIAQSDWTYDLYYNRSEITTNTSQRWPLTQPFDDYYLGPQVGIDPYGFGFPAYVPNLANFYQALTPSQWLQMTGDIHNRSVSWQQNVHLTLADTDLFKMKGGSAGFAGVAEFGNQAFHSPADPALIAGDFNGHTGFSGGGSRERWALGGELRLPVTSTLTADASLRYESYRYSTRSDSKPTYKVGLEWRPTGKFLLRANYATAFRAPDMYDIFQQQSGFYEDATDYYLCRSEGYSAANISTCSIPASGQVFSFYQGSPDLKDVTAQSWGYGAIWSPASNVTLKVDYTRFGIQNEIVGESINSLLEMEADCRLGTSFGGQTYDVNSPFCKQVLSQVHRYPSNFPVAVIAGQIQNVQTYPVNVASEWLDGIQASADYKFDIGRFGALDVGAQYYVELHHEYRQSAADAYIDDLHAYNSWEFKSRGSASVSWETGNWTTTLFGNFYGKSVNYGGTGTFGSWTTLNGSVNFAFHKDSSLQLTVNNVANRAPPADATFPGPSSAYPPPYYNVYSYNGYGRAFWLELKSRF